jgi:hypothetical protein
MLPTCRCVCCTCQNAIDDLKSDVEREVKEMLKKVLNLSAEIQKGTTIMDVTNGTDPDIIRRISSTMETTIEIACPDGT